MRITRLALSDVRRHRRLELCPAAGLTVIRGPNESGKSTIQGAVELALFRRATSAAADVAAVRSWGAEDDPTIELEFVLDGKPGRLAKRFAGSKGSVRLELDGVVDSDPGRVDLILAEALGIPSEKFLRSTASVRHFEMEDLDRDEKALRDRLQQSIGGGDVGASRARQRLTERIATMRAAGAKNPGVIRRTQEAIASLSTQLQVGEAALEQLARDRAAWAEATALRVALEAEVREAETGLGEAETAAKLGAERSAVIERYEQLRRATDLAERSASAEAASPTGIPLATLAPSVERLRALELQAADLKAQRAAIAVPVAPEPIDASWSGPIDAPVPEPVAVERNPVPPVGPWRPIAVGLVSLAVLALVSGLLLGSIGPVVGVAIALVAGTGGVALLVRDGRQRAARDAAIHADEAARQATARQGEIAAAARAEAARLAADADARRAAAQVDARRRALDAAAQADRQRSELDARLAATRDESARLLAVLGCPDRPAAEALLAAAQRHAAATDGIRAELRGLLGTDAVPPLEELRARRDEAAAQVALGGHALEGLGAAGADPERARLRAQAAVRSTQLRLRTAIDEEGQAKGRVSQNTADAELVAVLAEQLAARGEELALAERRLRIYQQTLDAITAAEAATIQKAARFLERRMGQDIARITAGRYERVRVDENDLGITVWSPERGAWVDATQLSKGTADQLYLAARLGLVRQVTQDRRPPLLFDDPFVTFDDERALRAMEVVRELAADHQVLYLTCSDRYDAAADAVVVLPPPATEPGMPRPEPPPPSADVPFALTLPLDVPAADG